MTIRMSKGLLAALFVSIVLAVCLSLLPGRALDQIGGDAFGVDAKRDVPVMKTDGVVDQLSSLKLNGHLQKINFGSDTLTVWLTVPQAALRQDRTWQDVYQIAYRFLSGHSAYARVEVRIVSASAPGDVQVAVIATPQEVSGGPLPGSSAVATYVRQKFNVIENGTD